MRVDFEELQRKRQKLHELAQALVDEMRRQQAVAIWVDGNENVLRLERRWGNQTPRQVDGYEYVMRYRRRRVKP